MHLKSMMNTGILIAAAFTVVWSCHLNRAWAETQSTGKSIISDPSGTPKTDKEEPTGILELKQAQSLALTKSPELAAFSWEIRAREAQALQAGLPANPELSLEGENFGASGGLTMN